MNMRIEACSSPVVGGDDGIAGGASGAGRSGGVCRRDI